MKTYTFSYHLYQLFDRAYEDCYADITVNVPDNWKETCPKLEEVSLAKIVVEKDSMNYLKSTYCTPKDEMVKKIGEAMDSLYIYNEFIEAVGDDQSLFGPLDDAAYEKWYETATEPEWTAVKPIEIVNAEKLFG